MILGPSLPALCHFYEQPLSHRHSLRRQAHLRTPTRPPHLRHLLRGIASLALLRTSLLNSDSFSSHLFHPRTAFAIRKLLPFVFSSAGAY